MIVSLKRMAALICVAGLGISAANAQCLTSSQTGTNNGYYFSFWKDSGGSVSFCNQAGGRYTSNWSNVNNWVGGKGWNRLPPGGELTRAASIHPAMGI